MSNIDLLVQPHAPVEISREAYPWINEVTPTVSVSEVTLNSGHPFLYGSIIDLNTQIRKIADKVPDPASVSAQNILFAGINAILEGQNHQNISKVQGSEDRVGGGTLFLASNGIVKQPGLFFIVSRSIEASNKPVVLRAGMSLAPDTPRVISLFGIKQKGGKRRRR